jgi:hypothetical protein
VESLSSHVQAIRVRYRSNTREERALAAREAARCNVVLSLAICPIPEAVIADVRFGFDHRPFCGTIHPTLSPKHRHFSTKRSKMTSSFLFEAYF